MNEHIENYLDYFLELKVSPEYAILLRGNWGSGKTWFIKNYLGNKSEIKYLYVSLNGVSSFQQIEDIFFQQVHPVLASKGMKLAGKILRGLVKTTIKVDLNNDSQDDGSIASSIPDINLPDYFKDLDSYLLIFDDLERCAIAIPVILGYINQFVETHGLKVIVLGNENEIIRREGNKLDNDSLKYLTIKEKLIGKSFDVQSDLKKAIDHFVSQIDSVSKVQLLKSKEEIILELFKTAGYGNLRHLRQAILDFGRFLEFLPSTITAKIDLVNHIVELFFCVSFEVKKGSIPEGDIPKLFLIDFLAHKSGDEKTVVQEIRSKYSVLGKYYHPIDYTLLEIFFKYGTLDKKQVQASINNSIYYQEENTPKWIKLWRFFDLNDKEFEEISSFVIKEFNELRILNKYELLQVSGLLLVLSERNLIINKKKEILDKSKASIDNLKTKGLLKKEKNEEYPAHDSHGLTIQGIQTKEFTELFEYAKQEVNNSLNDSYSIQAAQLLEKLSTSISEFGEMVTLSNSRNNLYFDIPIFTYIPVDDFASVVIKLDNKHKRELCRILEERYRQMTHFPPLFKEIDWLAELHEVITKEKDKFVGKVSGLTLDMFLKTIKNVVENIQIRSLENNMNQERDID